MPLIIQTRSHITSSLVTEAGNVSQKTLFYAIFKPKPLLSFITVLIISFHK